MDKDTAIKLLIAHAVCCLSELTCEDCPQWNGCEIDCFGADDKNLTEAVKVMQKDKETNL